MNKIQKNAEVREQNKRKILRFLRDETWTVLDVIWSLTGTKLKKTAKATLDQMIGEGLIATADLEVAYSRALPVYGITQTGLALAFDEGEEFVQMPTFSIAKIAASTSIHKIDLQFARLSASENGFEWHLGERLGLRQKGQKVPDAIANKTGFGTVAIELERTPKTQRRYSEIIRQHLIAAKSNGWREIVYLMPSDALKGGVKRIFDSVQSFKHKGQEVVISSEMREKFVFLTYEEFKLYGVTD